MRVLALLLCQTRLQLILLRRYLFDSLAGVVAIYLLFLLIFLGFRALSSADSRFGEGVPGMVVGFLVFSYCFVSFQQLSWNLMQEALQGTLEQLAMSPLGLATVLVCRTFVLALPTLVIVLVLLFLMMATSGTWLSLRLESLIPLLILTALGAQGVGFALGGLALVFKRVSQTFQIVQFVLLGCILLPREAAPVVSAVVPLSWGTGLVHRVMVEDVSFLTLPTRDLAVLLANGLAWFGVGLLVFRCMEGLARNRGLLGHY